jgi:eukaryotic-like serine/threonine-protein kinase
MVAPGAVTALIARLAHPPTQTAPPPLVPGTRVGRYEIIRVLGQGGFGTVYEAHDAAVNRLVALKVLHRTQAADPAAAREAEVAARLAHPNIASLHDAGVLDDGFVYLVYEILYGETLESRLARGPIPSHEALAIAAQVARALAYAHAHGVIHRDLKPANVFLTADGEVKVLDFGVALLFGHSAPAGGTPAYMAPEQRRGEPEDARTDVYALGFLVREMLSRAQGATDTADMERIPHAVRRVLASLLANDPAARPRSARAAYAELEAAHRALAAPRVRRRRIAFVTAALALAAGLAGVLVRERLRAGAPPAPAGAPSIAVLPFADLSPGRDQEYFADGIAEEILTALAQVDGLHVTGRTSSFAFKGRNEDLRTIGQRLGVGALLEGSVRKAGNHVRITAQVVSVADGYHLWAQEFDRDLTDVFAVEDEIARAAVSALSTKLLAGRQPSTQPRAVSNPEVHSQYLLGRSFYARGSADGYRRAVEAYEKALALDPGYAPAWAGLARALMYDADRAKTAAGVTEEHRRAVAAAEKAVALDPASFDGYAARGSIRLAQVWDWAGGGADLKRALALNPGDAEAHVEYARLLGMLGRLPEAVEECRRATDLDPLAPRAWRLLGSLYASAGRLGLAREAETRAAEISPEDPIVLVNLAIFTELEGRPAEALRMYERIREDPWRLMGIAMAQHDLGHPEESRKALDRLVATGAHAAAFQIAEVHAWRGERDEAFQWLERAYTQRDPGLIMTKISPALRGLHEDPRFRALLRRMELPEH